jgi:hypothetical protein
MEAQAGTGSNSGFPAFDFGDRLKRDFGNTIWPSEPGRGLVNAVVGTKGFREYLLLALDTKILAEVHEQENRGPDVPT